MKNLSIRTVAIGIFSLLWLLDQAHAGTAATSEVVIDDNFSNARGTFTAVRNSTDNSQYIFCFKVTAKNSTSTYETLQCRASNASNTFRSCATSSPELLAAFNGIGSKSYLSFNWNAQGECTQLLSAKGSPYIEKTN